MNYVAMFLPKPVWIYVNSFLIELVNNSRVKQMNIVFLWVKQRNMMILTYLGKYSILEIKKSLELAIFSHHVASLRICGQVC